MTTPAAKFAELIFHVLGGIEGNDCTVRRMLP
jgi:hypothetical protein